MALPKARTFKTILRQGYDFCNRHHLRLCILPEEVAGEWFFPSFTLIHGQDVWISEVRQQNPTGGLLTGEGV
jgi:cellobiose-specific phosphotransferase system component IIA